MTERQFAAYLMGKRHQWPTFDASSLATQFIPYFATDERITVTRVYTNGESYTRRGHVGITTGWRPAFLLMPRSTSTGSSDVLGPDDRIVLPSQPLLGARRRTQP